ncbi:MAG TPA: POTRA domain-containing protein [Myxococcales bacterium]|nr:POTRA domain-containing protein [Myxococcales bacterium]
MRRILPFLLLALCACATPSTPFEGRPVLTAIDFAGNRSISSSELRDKIATVPTSGFFKKTARYYDADLFAIDVKRIVRYYNQKGFYEARVTGVDEIRDDAGRVRLLVHIEEGRRAYVRDIWFVDTDGVATDEMAEIAAAAELQRGDEFDEDKYESSKGQIADQLKSRGFAEAEVKGAVRVAPEEGAAYITYKLDPGPRYAFGRVIVTGNRAVDTSEIVRATGIHRGDRFSPRAMQLAQQRVYNLGTFSGVRVALEPLGDSPVAAVRVTVREAPFQTIKVGVGGQIEEFRWELPRVRAEYTNRNLFGGLRRLELASTVGYAFVPSLPAVLQGSTGTNTQTGLVTLTSAQLVTPNVLVPGLDLISRIEFARDLQQGYGYDEVAARFGPLFRIDRHTVAATLNFVRYFNAGLNGVDLATLIQLGLPQLGGCIPTCTLTYPELRYTYDSRDNVLEPTYGFLGTFSIQQTLKPGKFSYFRFEPEVRAYFPIRPWLIVAARAQYGGLFLEGSGSVAQESPFQQRFFGGGQTYQRGYASFGQGPKVGGSPTYGAGGQLVAPGPVLSHWTTYAAIGGNGSELLSAELRFRTDFLLRHSGIVLFADASRITANPSLPWNGKLEVAPGVGLRYITPFGPIRLDVGYLLNPSTVIAPGGTYSDPTLNGSLRAVADTPVGPFCNEATGNCIYQRRWAYHITLGEAF